MELLKVKPDGFGSEIRGLNIETISDREITKIRELLFEHEVIFIKGCDILEPFVYRAFAEKLWGTLVHPFSSTNEPIVPGISPFQPYDDYPEITGIYHGKKNKGNLNEWHSDLNWLSKPSLGSILQAVHIPQYGGDTIWASMTRAFNEMPTSLKKRLEGLYSYHDFTQIYSGIFKEDEKTLRETQKRFPAAKHPILLVHPKSNKTAVFVNRVSTTHIHDMDPVKSVALLEEIYRWITKPEFQIRHSWQKGDIVIWDNLSTQHYAVSDYFPQERKMHRISLSGIEI